MYLINLFANNIITRIALAAVVGLTAGTFMGLCVSALGLPM